MLKFPIEWTNKTNVHSIKIWWLIKITFILMSYPTQTFLPSIHWKVVKWFTNPLHMNINKFTQFCVAFKLFPSCLCWLFQVFRFAELHHAHNTQQYTLSCIYTYFSNIFKPFFPHYLSCFIKYFLSNFGYLPMEKGASKHRKSSSVI